MYTHTYTHIIIYKRTYISWLFTLICEHWLLTTLQVLITCQKITFCLASSSGKNKGWLLHTYVCVWWYPWFQKKIYIIKSKKPFCLTFLFAIISEILINGFVSDIPRYLVWNFTLFPRPLLTNVEVKIIYFLLSKTLCTPIKLSTVELIKR